MVIYSLILKEVNINFLTGHKWDDEIFVDNVLINMLEINAYPLEFERRIILDNGLIYVQYPYFLR